MCTELCEFCWKNSEFREYFSRSGSWSLMTLNFRFLSSIFSYYLEKWSLCRASVLLLISTFWDWILDSKYGYQCHFEWVDACQLIPMIMFSSNPNNFGNQLAFYNLYWEPPGDLRSGHSRPSASHPGVLNPNQILGLRNQTVKSEERKFWKSKLYV